MPPRALHFTVHASRSLFRSGFRFAGVCVRLFDWSGRCFVRMRSFRPYEGATVNVKSRTVT